MKIAEGKMQIFKNASRESAREIASRTAQNRERRKRAALAPNRCA